MEIVINKISAEEIKEKNIEALCKAVESLRKDDSESVTTVKYSLDLRHPDFVTVEKKVSDAETYIFTRYIGTGKVAGISQWIAGVSDMTEAICNILGYNTVTIATNNDTVEVSRGWYDYIMQENIEELQCDDPEDPDEDVQFELVEMAFEDVRASLIKSDDPHVKVTISELRQLQELVEEKEYECGSGLDIRADITDPEILYEDDDDAIYSLFIDGSVYSTYISAEEAKTVILAYAKGYKKGKGGR